MCHFEIFCFCVKPDISVSNLIVGITDEVCTLFVNSILEGIEDETISAI